MMMKAINYWNTIFDKILKRQIVLFFVLSTILAMHLTNANIRISQSSENSSRTAEGSDAAQKASSSSSNTFGWGHVTKYSFILFDEDIVVKGSSTVNLKYPNEDDTNDFTIIGIYASENVKYNSGRTTYMDLSVSITEGGIGYNYTTIRFVSKSFNEFQYNVIIYGVNV